MTPESRVMTMKERSEKYKEILLLEKMLQEKKIPHWKQPLYDGFQIQVPLPDKNRKIRQTISVIEHSGSYGSVFDMIEIMNGNGSIQGYLTADAAMKVIEHEVKRRAPDK